MNTIMRLCLMALVLSILFLLFVPISLVAQEVRTDLSLRVLPGDYYKGLEPGVLKTVYVEVRNSGTRALTDICFRADMPEDWPVTFRPERLDFLAPGSSYTVDVDILPINGSESGGYTLNLIAEALETRAATTVFFQVEGGSGYWLWIGVGIAAVVIAGFIFVFRREGRK